jgi:hypothetical protein
VLRGNNVMVGYFKDRVQMLEQGGSAHSASTTPTARS